MRKDTTGWIVRTEENDRHRYWKVGAVEAAKATAMAATAAGTNSAYAATRLGTFDTARYAPTQGVAIEFEWESRPAIPGVQGFEADSPYASSESVIGTLTFDTIVPDSGLIHVEGCYRLRGGNWQVYYLTNNLTSGPPLQVPSINNKAIFSSGLAGVSGFFPDGWLLNKQTTARILADVLDVDGWVEMIGPDSLLLK